MNPILHDLHNKQWVWTAAHAKQQQPTQTLTTGFPSLDNVLTGGFPRAGLIHLHSPLGCGELRFMLSVLRNIKQSNAQPEKPLSSEKLLVFINPPFELNAEFLLAHQISLEQLIIVKTTTSEESLWSAEQCAKSGACESIFLWHDTLKHIQVKKLEHASQQGLCHCIWMHNIQLSNQGSMSRGGLQKYKVPFSCSNNVVEKNTTLSNLPLSLSLTVNRNNDELDITVNKQKVGWAQKPVHIPFPFINRTNRILKQQLRRSSTNKVLSIKCASSDLDR